MAVLSGQLADYLRETCLWRTVTVRKAFSIVGTARCSSSHLTLHTGFYVTLFLIIHCHFVLLNYYYDYYLFM